MKRNLCVFLKYPASGCVKTRLADSLGEPEAAEVYQRMTCEVLRQARKGNPDVISIFYAPAGKETEIKKWLEPWLRDFPGDYQFYSQSDGDLGHRLKQATETLFRETPNMALIIIGTDCIELDSELFSSAWAALERENPPIVVGPSADGGYYLIGITEPTLSIYDDVPWSTERVLSATLENAGHRHKECFLLPERTDIDTISEYQQFEDRLKKRPCVFFDRDGVVNESPGAGYVLKKQDFTLNKGIVESLQTAHDKGYLAMVMTSQKGVGKKLMSEDDLAGIHRQLQSDLAEDHAAFDAIYYYTGAPGCKHEPKPDPAMINAAASDFPIDLSQSWMIGDADRDIEMGKNANVRGTIRIRGDNPISVEADHTLNTVLELPELLRKLL